MPPRPGRPRSSPEFSDICLPFITGRPCLCFDLPHPPAASLWLPCWWHRFPPWIPFPAAPALAQTSSSLAWPSSAALSWFGPCWPHLPCSRLATLSPSHLPQKSLSAFCPVAGSCMNRLPSALSSAASLLSKEFPVSYTKLCAPPPPCLPPLSLCFAVPSSVESVWCSEQSRGMSPLFTVREILFQTALFYFISWSSIVYEFFKNSVSVHQLAKYLLLSPLPNP